MFSVNLNATLKETREFNEMIKTLILATCLWVVEHLFKPDKKLHNQNKKNL